VCNAIRSKLARRELAELSLADDATATTYSSSGERAGSGPVVTGIFIHPGERRSHINSLNQN